MPAESVVELVGVVGEGRNGVGDGVLVVAVELDEVEAGVEERAGLVVFGVACDGVF